MNLYSRGVLLLKIASFEESGYLGLIVSSHFATNLGDVCQGDTFLSGI